LSLLDGIVAYEHVTLILLDTAFERQESPTRATP